MAFHLLNPEQTAYARQRLLQALDRYGWRVGTGFLSTPLILDVLADIDEEAAYRLLENEEMPGWLFMPKNGATTVWEAWEGTQAAKGIASLNHFSKGAVCEWLFRGMCGLSVAGPRRFFIAPIPGGSLTHAEAVYDSLYGRVRVRWERVSGAETRLEVDVPPNCSASVRLPDGRAFELTTGTRGYLLGAEEEKPT